MLIFFGLFHFAIVEWLVTTRIRGCVAMGESLGIGKLNYTADYNSFEQTQTFWRIEV